jgi:GTP pyrophosphokinase
LKKYGVDFSRLLKAGDFDKAAKELGFHDPQDLFAAVGYKQVSINQILQKFVPAEQLEQQQKRLSRRQRAQREKKTDTTANLVQVRGLDNVLVNFAKCCSPLPGDGIVGYITKSRGVTVHSENCARLQENDPERKVEVNWSPSDQVTRPVRIKVLCQDRPGLLAKVSGAISRQNANIRGAQVATSQQQRSVSIFEIEVSNATHLENIIYALKKINGVTEVSRMRA